MSDLVSGDKVGGSKYVQSGDRNTFTVNNSAGVDRAELDAAVAELRAFIAQLSRDGAIAADGSVTDPGAVVAAVESQPGRLRALSSAIAGGATASVLAAVQGGVATLITALVGQA
ncbi:hypothetical protein ACF08N_26700 [Streptomyces sp. NPDC015127]|uniref:hypothetical protein n=1 Tax=Streptomyces sp. NPDC015127 TaxID=3364939 RepID=UPI0036FD47DF